MTRVPRLMLIVETADVVDRRDVIAAALVAGVDAIQLRDRRAAGGTMLTAALALRALTRNHGAAFLVNDRIDVALAAGADGVHLPAASFPIAVARRLLGPGVWIGRSTHAPAEAVRAAADGADYVVLGPIFPTPSKQGFGPPLGLPALAATPIGCPVIAIGGIVPGNVASLRGFGANGIAVIRAILDGPDPSAATHALRAAVDAALDLD